MSEAYERERQNNALLSELSHKVTALRGVTVDIYDQARDHDLIDNSNEVFASFNTSLRNSVNRVRIMGSTGGRVQILKMAAMLVGGVVVVYLIWGWLFG